MAKNKKNASSAKNIGKIAKQPKLSAAMMVPLILILGIIPLIVHLQVVPLTPDVYPFWK